MIEQPTERKTVRIADTVIRVVLGLVMAFFVWMATAPPDTLAWWIGPEARSYGEWKIAVVYSWIWRGDSMAVCIQTELG